MEFSQDHDIDNAQIASDQTIRSAASGRSDERRGEEFRPPAVSLFDDSLDGLIEVIGLDEPKRVSLGASLSDRILLNAKDLAGLDTSKSVWVVRRTDDGFEALEVKVEDLPPEAKAQVARRHQEFEDAKVSVQKRFTILVGTKAMLSYSKPNSQWIKFPQPKEQG